MAGHGYTQPSFIPGVAPVEDIVTLSYTDLPSAYHLHSFRKPGQIFRGYFWSDLSSDKLLQYLQETGRTNLKDSLNSPDKINSAKLFEL